jgi:hypothetical protein
MLRIRLLHIGGLAFALLLLAACRTLWLWLPGWVQGTPAQEFPLLSVFVGWVALLTAGDWLWRWVTAMTADRSH